MWIKQLVFFCKPLSSHNHRQKPSFWAPRKRHRPPWFVSARFMLHKTVCKFSKRHGQSRLKGAIRGKDHLHDFFCSPHIFFLVILIPLSCLPVFVYPSFGTNLMGFGVFSSTGWLRRGSNDNHIDQVGTRSSRRNVPRRASKLAFWNRPGLC